ncbi:hypothetical protein GCM10011506_26590 [Marivirga lumbricoides]|uniref:DUF4440 domain-containing protein n=1 Tax=Marivirga lumbricoides TaxID=1046115 RepID=A0ABQ1MFS6_9BACT|nr:hypothetical protein GCM10011506_26590 [Marivirga lumbricoides]
MRYIFLLSTLFSLNFTLYAQNSEKEVITALLNDFLKNVDDANTHDRFWAEDLIYTSSAGKRFGKPTIMQGFKNSEEANSDAPKTSYLAEEIQIKVVNDVAILTFKLIAKSEGEQVDTYFNSGVFQKKEGAWKVINWQATRAEQ